MALRALVKIKEAAVVPSKASPVLLYRTMIKELPRVLTIYDISMPIKEARAAIKHHFLKNASMEDPRLISFKVARGYMDLEETLMQWRQKTHMLLTLQPPELSKKFQLTEEQKSQFLYDPLEESPEDEDDGHL